MSISPSASVRKIEALTGVSFIKSLDLPEADTSLLRIHSVL